jgi:hypothetical protein
MDTKKIILSLVGILLFGGLIGYAVIKNYNPRDDDDDALMPWDCGNGKKALVYKHPGRMFPVIIRDFSTSFKITTDIINSLLKDSTGSFAVGAETNNKMQRLRRELDQDNIFYENQLKAIFFEVNKRPCDDSLSKEYIAYIKEMSFKVIQMKQFVSDVSKPGVEMKDKNKVSKDPVIVIDTSKAEVKQLQSTENIKPSELVVLKEYGAIVEAVSSFNNQLHSHPAEYRVLLNADRYTGKSYLSRILADNGDTVLTVHVTDVNMDKHEGTMYLSRKDEKTLPFKIKESVPVVHYLDNDDYKATITVTRFGRRGTVRVAYYTISIEKRI